jgi:2,5-diamino-6-(ribosylamino)-4(3H)-pyrimidinone 5'-phosphate reductase
MSPPDEIEEEVCPMLPRVVMFNEISVDGRIDGFSVDMGRYYGLAARWEADAMLSGSNTLLNAYGPEELLEEDGSAFEPPSRDPEDTRQLLVVADSRGRLRSWHLLRKEPYWRDVIALCSRSTPQSALDYLHTRHVETIVTGAEKVDLRAALEELNARHGVELVRVDSGGTLNGALLRAGLVSEVSVLINPCLVGGATPGSIFRATDPAAPGDVIPLRLIHLEKVSDDAVWLRYEVVG